MGYKIEILAEAQFDIIDGRNYYSAIFPSLGKKFVNDLKNVVADIEKRPKTFGFRFGEFRTANFNIFLSDSLSHN